MTIQNWDKPSVEKNLQKIMDEASDKIDELAEKEATK